MKGRRSGNDWEEPDMVKERTGGKVRGEETVMTAEDNITGYNLRRIL